jgi:hypothetical protein
MFHILKDTSPDADDYMMMMEAANTTETSANFTRLHGATS